MNDQKAEQQFEKLAELAREGAARAVSARENENAKLLFLERVDEQFERRARPSRAWTIALPSFALAAGIALFLFLPRGLDFEVKGAASEDGYVRAPATGSVEIAFTDQTKVIAAPDSRLRVEVINSNGARVLVEQGRTDVHVVHRSGSQWSFLAGPFEVHVTGTRFSFDWDPKTEKLEVVLKDGGVRIDGFPGSGPIALRAGQRFLGDAARRTMVVADASTPSPASVEAEKPETAKEPPTEETVGPARQSPGTSSATPETPRSAARPTWAQLVSRGQFSEIVEDAKRRGLSSCFESCPSSELRALADAARYTSEGNLAEQSLLALKRRFPSEAEGANFLLGRLYEGRGAKAQARSAYEAYLKDSAQGSFASEALAGKMRMVHALEGREKAVPVAREYLKRFPSGVHAKTANELIR